MATIKDDITYIHPDFSANQERWKLVRDVCASNNLHDYILPLCPMDTSIENQKRNELYKERAVFLNATGRTQQSLTGLAFKKEPLYESCRGLQYLKLDADGAGVSIYQQSQFVLSEILQVDKCGLYVDFNEESKKSIILMYCRESIVNWRVERVNGRDLLTLIVLVEHRPKKTSYSLETETIYRELFIDDSGVFSCRVWGYQNNVLDVIEMTRPVNAKGEHFTEIPFFFVGSKTNSPVIDKAPLFDLAKLNIAHYRNSADYEDSAHMCGQIQPFITGLIDENWRNYLEKKGVNFGSGHVMLLPSGATVGLAQAAPNSLVKEAMTHKEDQMLALGARLIEKSAGNKTATQASSEESAATSVLSICCSNISEAYCNAINACQNYMGFNESGKYTLNQDFTAWNIDPQTISAVMSLSDSGKLPDGDLFNYLRLIGLIRTDKTDEQIKSELEAGEQGIDLL
jgi:hypothetical protein